MTLWRIIFPILIVFNAYFINKGDVGWFNAIVVGFVCGTWMCLELYNLT